MLRRWWDDIKPTYHARRGAVLAALATVAWAACVAGSTLESGFGLLADFSFVALVLLIAIPLAMSLVALVLSLFRLLPRVLSAFFIACAGFICLLWLDTPGLIFALTLLFVECCFGATLATVARGGLSAAPLPRRIATWTILLLSLAANFGIFTLLHSDGMDDDLAELKDARQTGLPPELHAPDPSKTGPYKVLSLYYGSGDSLRRPEFGPSAAIKTGSVDASLFFKDYSGWKPWLRKQYWGFGIDKLPLNARVFYPDAKGPFPLFVFVHGNHQMSVASDKGYDYLCHLLAGRGFIAVTVDENFLNSGPFYEPPRQQSVRGWLLLEHLRLWHEWAKDPKNPLYGKADLSHIALGGHSRGGEAAATAALFNRLSYFPEDGNIQFHYGYAIQSVIAIAPADGQYKPAEQWRVLNDVNYLTLQGANDSDVSSFAGSQQYDRVRFSGAVPAFKSELYIYRANHGQFNTMWGRTDRGAPSSWFLNLRPLLSPDAQRQISKLYISAFLEATLRGHKEYVDLFRDYRRARQWLPDTLYLNRFQDQSYKAVCRFDEDADLTSTTMPGGHIGSAGLSVWHEGNIPLRSGSRNYNGVFLGWNWEKARHPPAIRPSYTVDFPAGNTGSALELSVAVTDDDAPVQGERQAKSDDDAEEKDGVTDFSIEATSGNGAAATLAAHSFAFLPPPFHVQFTKLERLDTKMFSKSAEPVFQTIRVPFAAFKTANAAFDPRQARRIRLVFDKTPARVIVISGIGLAD